MSDEEGGGRSKQQGYRLEYASSARAGCKGPKPCGKENKIAKGELRLGSVVDFQGNTSFAWRHIGCITRQVISNIKKLLGDDPSDIDGFEDLNPEDQARITRIFEEGDVRTEDKPECAKYPLDEDGNEMKPGRARKPKAEPLDGEEVAEQKPAVPGSSEMEDIKPVPKKKAAPKPKKEKVKPELDEDGNPIKKKGGRIAVKAAGAGTATKAKPKAKPKAKGKGKKRKADSASEDEAEASAEETPAEESDAEARPAKKAKKSRKAKDESDSEGFVIPREPSTRARRGTKKSLKEESASEDEDEKPDIKRGSSSGAENGGAEASTSANVKDEEDDE